MARKLKVYTTSIGFFDLAIAAPSMKVASESWGADPDIFGRGFAKQTDDAAIVDAAMANPGVVLRRPVGSKSAFKEHAALPKGLDARPTPPKPPQKRPTEQATGEAARDRVAAQAYEKEQALWQAQERKQQAQREREAERQERVRFKADAELERARKGRDERIAAIEKRRKELDAEADAAEKQWEKARDRHRKATERPKA